MLLLVLLLLALHLPQQSNEARPSCDTWQPAAGSGMTTSMRNNSAVSYYWSFDACFKPQACGAVSCHNSTTTSSTLKSPDTGRGVHARSWRANRDVDFRR